MVRSVYTTHTLLLILLFAAVLLVPAGRIHAQATHQPTTDVRPGESLERELKGGETQTFAVRLTSGEFLHAVVEQNGIDVEVTLLGPAEEKLVSVDGPNDQYGPELIVWESQTAGVFQIKVRSLNSKSPIGRYRLVMMSRALAGSRERELLAAARAFEEGQKLRAQRTADSRQAAIKKYEQALMHFGAVGDKYWQGLTLYRIGSTHAQSSDFPKALARFQQALGLFQDIGDQRREAATLNFIGGAQDVLGDQAQALESYGKALPIYDQVDDRSTKASILNNIGKVNNDLGQWQKALGFYNEALKILQSLDDGRQAAALHNIARMYLGIGDTERALSNAEQSLKVSRARGDKETEADTLGLVGLIWVERGQGAKALEYYGQALPLRRSLGDPRGEATTLDQMGVAYSAADQAQKALEQHQQALALRRKIGDRRNEGLTLANLGHVYNGLNRPAEAAENYNNALEVFRSLNDRSSIARALVGIARVKTQQGEFAEAHKLFAEALQLIEELRSQAGGQVFRASYFAKRQDDYKLFIDLLMEQHRLQPNAGHDAAALQTSERAHARSMLELLNEAHVDIRQGVDAKLIDRERELSQLLSAKAQRQIQLRAQNAPRERTAALEAELTRLEAEFEEVKAAIRSSSPAYAALTQPQPLSLRAIQAQLDPNTVLLEYSLGDERSFVWAVTQNKLTTHELPKRAVIQKAARQVYELLTARSITKPLEQATQKRDRVAQADVQLSKAIAELSQMVLKPVAAELGSKRLVIVADDALHYVPLAALSVADAKETYRPLILDHEIISLPSASALAVQRKNLAGRKLAPKSIAIFADPVFSKSDQRVKSNFAGSVKSQSPRVSAETRSIEHEDSSTISLGKFAIRRLRFTRQEAEEILAVAPGAGNLKALDFKASRRAVMADDLSQYRYVHFATHGYLDTERPDLSAIVLSLVDERGNSQDGFLRALEIYNLDLPVELVVLSACQTGLGEEMRGEGLVGLTRGFMYAGARRVVVSLWNVNDKATAELMQRFYRGMLKENQTPAASLRNAQAEMSRQKEWQSPYYWAAFALQGEWK